MNETGKNELNVLYCCDENYAPFAGVSMTSLFMNNRDIEKITVYLALDNVSKVNKARYKRLADEYGRKVVLIDAALVVEKIMSYNIPMWRNGYAANIRLFFPEYIHSDVERLLYLDSDTIITGSLKPLLQLDFANNCIAMTLCSMMTKAEVDITYKTILKHNSGVMLINAANWINGKWMDKLIYHIENVRARYPAPDQDLLNIVCAGHILRLPQEYNFPPLYRAYSDDIYFKTMKNTRIARKEIEYAREHPVIYHTYRFLGQFPWHRDTLHPDKEIFDEYLEKSLWRDYERKLSPQNTVFKIERVLYKILPKSLFFKLFTVVYDIDLRRQNKKLLKEEKKSRAGK